MALPWPAPHYETLGAGDSEGGGFYPGAEVSLVDLKTGQSRVLKRQLTPWDDQSPMEPNGLPMGTLLLLPNRPMV
jgi:hypothetical protein